MQLPIDRVVGLCADRRFAVFTKGDSEDVEILFLTESEQRKVVDALAQIEQKESIKTHESDDKTKAA